MYAGTHGQMVLAGDPVFLDADGHRIPVARWLWKVVVDRQDDAGIAFICSNDPFDRTERPPCGGGGHHHDVNQCGVNGWDIVATSHGVLSVYCCTVSQLKETVPEARDVDDAEKMLKGMPSVDDLKDVADDAVATEGDESSEEEEEEMDGTADI